jgi:hypothetical protein
VTATINAATKGKEGQDYETRRDAAVATIERDMLKGGHQSLPGDFVLRRGQQCFTPIANIPMCGPFAVEFQTAFFGGALTLSFNFPRYDLDFSFLRLYENGRPVSTPEHLRWSAAAPKDRDVVFVAGNPGGTDRLLTADQLTTLRDLYPLTLMLGSELRGRYTRFGEESAEHARIVNRSLFGTENGLKAARGQFLALQQLHQARQSRCRFKAKVDADPMLKAAIGDPWSEIAKVQAERVARKPYYMLEARAGYGAALCRYARHWCAEPKARKINAERLREYAEARLPLLQRGLLDVQPVRATWISSAEFWLTKLREELTADARKPRYSWAGSPEDLARELATRALTIPSCAELWDGGLAAIKGSNDP